MKLKIFKDSIAAAAAKVLAACLPFLTIGMLGCDVAAIVSGIVGAVALVTLIVRAVMLLGKIEVRIIESLDGAVSDILSFPYAIALSSMIAIPAGYDATPGLWFAAILAALALIPGKSQS